MKYRRSLHVILLILFAIASSGCSIPIGSDEKDPVDPSDPRRSMVFGYIDMSDAPSSLGWVKLKRYKPEPNHFYHCGIKEGLFWHVGIEPGSYQVESFGKDPGFFTNTYYKYDFGTSGRNKTARRINTPGLYFLGGFKYREIEAQKWYAPDKFEMVPMESRSEKEWLTKLLEIMQNDAELMQYKRQISWAKERLALLD